MGEWVDVGRERGGERDREREGLCDGGNMSLPSILYCYGMAG